MTQPSSQDNSVRTTGAIRTGIVTTALVAALALTGGGVALAGGGGIGSGGGGGGGGDRDRYDRYWDDFRYKDKRWAKKTSECESGRDPNAYNSSGPYYGAFQFLKSTWSSSPKSPGGKPTRYNWKTQAVVAVKLKHRDGKGHWPVCG